MKDIALAQQDTLSGQTDGPDEILSRNTTVPELSPSGFADHDGEDGGPDDNEPPPVGGMMVRAATEPHKPKGRLSVYAVETEMVTDEQTQATEEEVMAGVPISADIRREAHAKILGQAFSLHPNKLDRRDFRPNFIFVNNDSGQTIARFPVLRAG